MSKEELDGVWRTVRGRRIFIKKGESLGEAMSRSGKFKRSDIREEKTSLRAEDYMDKIKNKSVASKKNQKETDKYYKKTAKKGEYTKFGYEPNTNNQVEKNRINENAKVNENAKTRVERFKNRYSDTDKREIRHEEVQKKLADYKAKKQSNNKVESEYELYKRAKERPETIDAMTENSTDWEALEEKYGKTYSLEKEQQKKYDAVKKYVEKKKSNNNINYSSINKDDTFEVIEKSGETITMKVGNKMGNGYYTEGRAKNGGRIAKLVSDEEYEKLSMVDKLYAIPYSKTKNWKKKGK